MGAFILAGFVWLAGLVIAFFWAYAQSMATAPQYDNTPYHIMTAVTILSLLIIASHWLPNVGW